jgi:hypothetical protein
LNKKIAIVLIIVLSMASLCLTFTPKAKADNSDIKILSYSWYVAPADTPIVSKGDFVVVGEIQNSGSQIIDKPWVQAIAYTSDGIALASVYNPAYVKDILPQQKAPFYLDFTTQAADPTGNYSGTLSWIPFVAYVNATVGYGQVTEDQMYRGVVVVAKANVLNDPFTVTGILQNSGSEPSGKVLVVTTFYDTAGKVIAANLTDYLTSSLIPNGTASFTVTPMDNTASLSSQITSYSLLVQTLEVDNSTVSSPTPVASQSPAVSATPSAASPTPASSEHPTQSPQGQQSSADLIYVVVGAVVVAIIVVAALFFLRKKR